MRRKFAPVVKVDGYVPDLSKNPPVSNFNITREEIIPISEERGRSRLPVDLFPIFSDFNIPEGLEEEQRIRRHQKGDSGDIDFFQIPDVEEDILSKIDESSQEVQAGIIGTISPDHRLDVLREVIIRSQEGQIVAVCCSGAGDHIKITNEQLDSVIGPKPLIVPRSLEIAEVMERKFGNMHVVSPGRFFNREGKWRYKQ